MKPLEQIPTMKINFICRIFGHKFHHECRYCLRCGVNLDVLNKPMYFVANQEELYRTPINRKQVIGR